MRIARTEKRLKQKELSALTGLAQSTVSDVERGRTKPQARVRKLVEAFLGPVDWEATRMEHIFHLKPTDYEHAKTYRKHPKGPRQ